MYYPDQLQSGGEHHPRINCCGIGSGVGDVIFFPEKFGGSDGSDLGIMLAVGTVLVGKRMYYDMLVSAQGRRRWFETCSREVRFLKFEPI